MAAVLTPLAGSFSGVGLDDDVDGDHHDDMRVTVRSARVRVPRQPPCRNMGSMSAGQPPPNLPHPPRQTLDFIATGATLAPTPATARALDAIAKLQQ